MEWIRGTELEDIRYLNKSTDEEWKVVKNFILCGGCNSLEEKIICYKNMLENHDWYETSLVDAISTNDIIAEAVSAFLKFIFLLAVFADKMPKVIAVFLASDIILYRVVNKIISIKKHKEAKAILSELENQLKEQVKAIYQRDDEIIREISSTLDTIAQVKYPGYQSDLAQIREITYTYAKISPEETHELDLAPFKRQECYSRLAKIQLNAYLKIEEMVKMQETNNEEQISDNKQNHLEQQLKNSIDKKIEEILNTNLDDEKTCKENKDIQVSPQLARVKIRTK